MTGAEPPKGVILLAVCAVFGLLLFLFLQQEDQCDHDQIHEIKKQLSIMQPSRSTSDWKADSRFSALAEELATSLEATPGSVNVGEKLRTAREKIASEKQNVAVQDFSACSRNRAVLLNESEWAGEQFDLIALASFPRSGNSMIRLLLEKVTGILTGSIYHDDRLIDNGWKGEGLYGPGSSFFVKTHDPLFGEFSKRDFTFDRVIHVVRDPFDAFDSYFHFKMTRVHDQNLSEDQRNEAQGSWEEFVASAPFLWRRHYEYWREKSKAKETLLVRYEDLRGNPQEQLDRILRWAFRDHPRTLEAFLGNIPCTCDSTFGKQASSEGYKPRAKVKKPFTKQEQAFIFKATYPHICDLGYQGVEGVFSCLDEFNV